MFWQTIKNKWQILSNRKSVAFSEISNLALEMKTYSTIKPTHEKDWNIDHAKLPHAEINGDMIKIYNIRNFKYKDETIISPDFYNKTFDLKKLSKVYYVVSHFANFNGIAHTFLSFEFDDDKYISLSIEARRTKKQKEYSLLKGFFKQYEMIYVLGDENDILKVRTNIRKERVHFYPVNATPQKVREMFLAIIKRVNKIYTEAEFYNTADNNCTNNLVNHVVEITNHKIPWSYKIFLPGYSDKLAYQMNFIPTDKSFREIKKRYLIDNEKLINSNGENYSKAVRKLFN